MKIPNLQNSKLTKSIAIRDKNINTDDRTIELSFSSNEPYDRWGDIFEVLEHSSQAIDFSRLDDSAPLLYNHNHSKQIGVVESAWLDGDKCRARVKFSKKAEAQEVYQDILDGIIKNVSVGYQVLDVEYKENSDTVVVKKWQPYEISIVSVPADPTVGVDRSFNFNKNQGDNNMSEKSQPQEHSNAINLERSRVIDIQAIAEKYDCNELVQKHIGDGTTSKAFESIAVESKLAKNKKKLADMEKSNPNIDTSAAKNIGMSNQEIGRFSLVKAINYLANPTLQNAERAAFELEASDTAIRKLGKDASFVIPADVLQRDFTTIEGGDLVATNLQPNSFIKMLKNESAVLPLVKLLTGLTGNIDIPMQTDSSKAYWLNENDEAGEGNYKTSMLTLSPKTIGVQQTISRKMLMNATPSAESLIRQDLVEAIALGIDLAILYGTGVKDPKGLTNTTGVSINEYTHVDLATLVKLETLVAQNNANTKSMKYLMNPLVRGACKSTPRVSGSDVPLWEANNTLNGYETGVSNQILPYQIIFGDFSQIWLGIWEGLALHVDPHTQAGKGAIRLVAMQDVDVAVKRPESFAIANKTATPPQPQPKPKA